AERGRGGGGARGCAPGRGARAGGVVGGGGGRGGSGAGPRALKAAIALRTVWSWQPSCAPITRGISPRADASRIWHRRRTKASDERKPAVTASRSASVSERTNTGGLIPACPLHFRCRSLRLR